MLVDSSAVKAKANIIEGDALALAEGVHQFRQGCGELHLDKDLVAILCDHAETDVCVAVRAWIASSAPMRRDQRARINGRPLGTWTRRGSAWVLKKRDTRLF
jgi:hypothetical protein